MTNPKKKSTSISSWPEDEQPQKQLLKRGAEALTDAELIAILLRAGVKGAGAVDLSRQLLEEFGSLRAMAEAPILALLESKGLKGAKAAQLTAAMEISRRCALISGGEMQKILTTKHKRDLQTYASHRDAKTPDTSGIEAITKFEELDIVKLTTNTYKKEGLKKGEEGTIVLVHQGNGKNAYEVEFNNWTESFPIKVKTLMGDEIEMVKKWCK